MLRFRHVAPVLALAAFMLCGCKDRFMIVHTAQLARVKESKEPARLIVVAQSPTTDEFRGVSGNVLDIEGVRHPDILGPQDTGYRQVALKQRRALVISG